MEDKNKDDEIKDIEKTLPPLNNITTVGRTNENNNNNNTENPIFEHKYYDISEESFQKKVRRSGTLNNKYEDIFSLQGQEKILLDRISLDGRYYYSMWQLKQKLSEKITLDVSRKNKLRYIIQNRTKKDNPENVIKLFTKPAKEEMDIPKHLLTPNKYSTFISVDEFLENGSFGFIYGNIQESQDVPPTNYNITPRCLGKKDDDMDNDDPISNDTPNDTLRNMESPPDNLNSFQNNNNNIQINLNMQSPPSHNFNNAHPNNPIKQNITHILNEYDGNNTIQTNNNDNNYNANQMNNNMGYTSNYATYQNNNNYPLIDNQQMTNNSPIGYPQMPQNQYNHQNNYVKLENKEEFTNYNNINSNNNNYNVHPMMMSTSDSYNQQQHRNQNNIVDDVSNSGNDSYDETFEDEDDEPNTSKNPNQNKSKTQQTKKRISEVKPQSGNKKAKTTNLTVTKPTYNFANVPIVKYSTNGTLHHCNISGHEVSFITLIDLKNLMVEQLNISDKNKVNSISQSIENALSSESPRFDISTYSSHFEFIGRNNFTRIFILHPNKVVKQKYHIFRDQKNNRWLLKMIKNYKHIHHATVFVLNDSQLLKKMYLGPTEKVQSLIENLGYFSSFSNVPTNKEENPLKPNIEVLLFRREDNDSEKTTDCCFSNQRYILNVMGQYLLKNQYTSVVFSISPVPLNYGPQNDNNVLYYFECFGFYVDFISESCLAEFLSKKEININIDFQKVMDFLYYECPSFKHENVTLRPFFLVDMCVPGKFELKRVSKTSPIWHLYLYSEQKTIVIDCSKFSRNCVTNSDCFMDLFKFYKTVTRMDSKVSGFFSNYLAQSNENFPPHYSVQLVYNPQKLHEKFIQDIYIPPLKSGIYFFWISCFVGSHPVYSLSKEFKVVDKVI